MEIFNEYFINENTVNIKGNYSSQHGLYSDVIEGEEKFIVTMTPLEIIKLSLLDIGSSLERELKLSRFLFGDKKRYPLIINAASGIIFVPLDYIERPCSSWFSLTHVKNIEHLCTTRSKVYTSFGHSVVTNLKENTINTMLEKAKQLRKVIGKCSKCPLTLYLEPGNNFVLGKNPKERSCNCNK